MDIASRRQILSDKRSASVRSQSNFYGPSSPDLGTERPGRAVYADTDAHNKIIFEGSNFSYVGDALTGGTITDITFTDNDGDVYASLTNADYDPGKLGSVLETRGFEGMIKFAFRDDDVLNGSSARDVLRGGNGDDI